MYCTYILSVVTLGFFMVPNNALLHMPSNQDVITTGEDIEVMCPFEESEYLFAWQHTVFIC